MSSYYSYCKEPSCFNLVIDRMFCDEHDRDEDKPLPWFYNSRRVIEDLESDDS